MQSILDLLNILSSLFFLIILIKFKVIKGDL